MSYVSKLGSDSGDGTVDNPWLTIQHGIDNNIDDILIVRGGDYHEVIRHNRVNHIKAYDGETPRITGLAGVESTNSGLPNGRPARTDPISGKYYVHEGLMDFVVGGVIMDGFEIVQSMGRTVRFYKGASNNELRNCILGNGRGLGILLHTDGVSNNLIDNCDVYDMSNFASYARGSGELDWSAGINDRGSDNIIRNCRVYENWGEGIIAGRDSDRSLIEDCSVYNNYAVQIYGDNTIGTDIIGNTVWFDDPKFYRNNRPSFGIVLNSEVEKHRTGNCQIIGNTVKWCGQNIGLWDYMSDVLVEENTLIEAYTNTFVSYHSGFENTIIRNNTIYQEDESKIWNINAEIATYGNVINPIVEPPPPPPDDILERLDALENHVAAIENELLANAQERLETRMIVTSHEAEIGNLQESDIEQGNDIDELVKFWTEIRDAIEQLLGRI